MANDIYERFIGTVQNAGLTNPYGLAAVAATGKHESGYSPGNAYGTWNDPSERGQAGTSGGILSWRAERLDGLRNFASAQGDNPNRPSPETQALYFAQEDPGLIERLNNASSVDEAQNAMNGAWRFAGYDRPGGEAEARRRTARGLFENMDSVGDSPSGGYTREFSSGEMMAGYPSRGVGLGNVGAMALGEEPAPKQGGIGGFLNEPAVGDALRAIGMSLMSSPSNSPLAGFGEHYSNFTDQRQERDQQAAQTRTFESALGQMGMSAEQAATFAQNPQAAKMLLEHQLNQQEELKATSQNNQSVAWLYTVDPKLAEFAKANPSMTAEAVKEALKRQNGGTEPPKIAERYNEKTGQPEKVVFNPATQAWEPFGGQKVPSNGITIGANGEIQIGGPAGAKMPSGFQPDPETPGAIMPIPGGPGEQISGELAARIGLADKFLKRAPALREKLASGGASGPYDVFNARNNQLSPQAEIHRELEYGVEALVRMLTGAGMNMSEAEERARRYLPTYTDNAQSMTTKLDSLTDYLNSTKEMAMRGRGGRAGAETGSSPGTAPADPYQQGSDPEIDDLVRRYGG
ncbi:hypothetical protein U0C82_18560 [Fulvimarina sp. 2208YS6-2-32]|uniref:Phage tail lysozyme domain-containing protein n=1 Tax=Fulvimarina uroteuthidis TaxID=3098149 RepID=A0ABU5I6Y5_9HYPH|nr:phage tail tip lysozyme [Fulvimarina sp. 2208YS6-2-32]MDY8111127.1 hypothetical protein [Fulvimarina sp. 2208YS6-2-32]